MKVKRKYSRRFFIHSGILTLFMITITSLFYFKFNSDVFILAIGWAGMFFMSEYHYQVVMLPLENSIGRLEGKLEALGEIKKILKDAKKKR